MTCIIRSAWGYDEPTYHNALARRFRKKGIAHRSKEHKTLFHRGVVAKEFEADFVNFDKIILELKVLHSDFIQANYVQILSELKLWQKQLGLLVNFGLQKVEIERIPFTEKAGTFREDYDYIKGCVTETDRNILAKVRAAVLHVFQAHGIGYGETACRRLVEAELDFRQIRFQNRAPIEVVYEDEVINTFKMKPLLIENQLICDVRALCENIDLYDIAKVQSYLRALGLRIGLVVNFGKTELEMRGIRA